MTGGFLVVLITAPSLGEAQRMADVLVEERLAACVNLVPGVRSVYRWEGKLQHDDEVLMIVKTAASAFNALEARVGALHPYEVPEILGLSPQAVSESYLAFLEHNTDG